MTPDSSRAASDATETPYLQGMRVAVVDPPSFTRPYDHELCRALASVGNDVELITSAFDHGHPPEPTGYRVSEPFYTWRPGRRRSTVRKLAKAAQHPFQTGALRRRASQFDVLHFQWLVLPALEYVALPRTRPIIVTVHNAVRRGATRGRDANTKRLLRSVDGVIVHTVDGRERLIEDVGLRDEIVEVIPHGVFGHLTEQPSELSLPPALAAVTCPVVLMFGVLRPYKGLDTLLEAWRGITGSELWIVGDDQMHISDLRGGAPPNVRFITRFVADAEMPAFFRRADLVVLPYREIDQSGVAFAAIAFGTPLLLTAIGGFLEIAAAGAAELVPPDDAAALQEQLSCLLESPERLQQLRDGGRRAAETTYSWNSIARNTTAFYHRIQSIGDW